MKRTRAVVTALLLLSCFTGCQSVRQVAARKNASRPAYEVRNVLRALNAALQESQAHRPAGFPDLKHVEVQLQAKTERDAGGQVKFVLVSGGVDTSTTHSTSLTLELEAPNEPQEPAEAPGRARPGSPIAQAIQAAKRAYLGEQRAGAGPLSSFERGDITVEIAFEISDKASAGVESGDLLPVGLSASASVSAGKTHHVKLVYGKR